MREAALVEAQEASRKAVEEAALLRERASTVEEATSKAREEALSYKNTVADLDKEKGLLQTELASARETFQRKNVECVNGEIARSAAEEAKRKALEDLEAERARSHSLSDDVDRLKRALLEKRWGHHASRKGDRRSSCCQHRAGALQQGGREGQHQLGWREHGSGGEHPRYVSTTKFSFRGVLGIV